MQEEKQNMNDAIMIELRFFGVSVFWGMLLLIMYDLLRILRRIIVHNNFFIALEDILFWITCSFLIFRMMYQQNNGIIRGFSILAMLLGMLIYHDTISEPLVNIVAGAFNKIIHGIAKLITLILKPIRFIIKKVVRLFTWLLKKMRKMAQTIVKALKSVWNSSKIVASDNEKGD